MKRNKIIFYVLTSLSVIFIALNAFIWSAFYSVNYQLIVDQGTQGEAAVLILPITLAVLGVALAQAILVFISLALSVSIIITSIFIYKSSNSLSKDKKNSLVIMFGTLIFFALTFALTLNSSLNNFIIPLLSLLYILFIAFMRINELKVPALSNKKFQRKSPKKISRTFNLH